MCLLKDIPLSVNRLRNLGVPAPTNLLTGRKTNQCCFFFQIRFFIENTDKLEKEPLKYLNMLICYCVS